MKQITLLTLTALLIMTFTGNQIIYADHHEEHTQEVNAQGVDLATHSKSAILMERDTGTVLYEKSAGKQLPPASMTKIMTMLLIMEALEKGQLTLDEKVRISENAASMGGSQIFLEEGEEMTVEDLLKGVAVASGNDASVALAERIAGSEESFVQMMNERVEQLGLEDTHFQNATGLPADNHISTAHDMAVMAKELLKYESITDYTSIYEDYLRKGEENEFWLVNTNKLVKFYDGVDGLKTGYTSEAKYCLTATAEINGMRTIAVVMGADTTKNRNSDVSQLLDYAYAKYETKPLFEKHQTVTTLDWLKADKKEINVVTNDSISLVYEKGTNINDIETTIRIRKNIELPLEAGTSVGMLEVKEGDTIVNETDLVLLDEVDKANVFQLIQRTFQTFFKK
ncbi:D-alanyl-D-alanine carboxypeptidase family protein [Gracilibacillus sp. YIM 98692]|uniref:D-alanyl-D-alanine carboxypeptidase family protein n=1 Tax=Gracilibacillus sp. YIM 98692 TaxID=2663532 RepID=UPI001F09A058|nr:D-alanyl-D-alanine carboxypeptidase family protein [Gracilibacillus sp. YIM 98692]